MGRGAHDLWSPRLEWPCDRSSTGAGRPGQAPRKILVRRELLVFASALAASCGYPRPSIAPGVAGSAGGGSSAGSAGAIRGGAGGGGTDAGVAGQGGGGNGGTGGGPGGATSDGGAGAGGTGGKPATCQPPCGTRQFCDTTGTPKCMCTSDPYCTSSNNACVDQSTLGLCAEDSNGCFYKTTSSPCTKRGFRAPGVAAG